MPTSQADMKSDSWAQWLLTLNQAYSDLKSLADSVTPESLAVKESEMRENLRRDHFGENAHAICYRFASWPLTRSWEISYVPGASVLDSEQDLRRRFCDGMLEQQGQMPLILACVMNFPPTQEAIYHIAQFRRQLEKWRENLIGFGTDAEIATIDAIARMAGLACKPSPAQNEGKD